jgi:hypothetical protein
MEQCQNSQPFLNTIKRQNHYDTGDGGTNIYGHWIPGEGRSGLEAAMAGGAGREKIVPFSEP